jgi:hypothetical protein
VHDSIVANNYIHDLDGPDVSQGDGIEIKAGSTRTSCGTT